MNKFIISTVIFSLSFLSCTLIQNPDEGVIYYYGFDFSIGNLNSNFAKNDIIAILDYNPSVEPIERSSDIYLLLDTLSLRQNIKDYGEETFNAIDRVLPTLEFDSISPPVIAGHLYLIKCKDGFAKFRVMSVTGVNIFRKEIAIIYEFTDYSVF